MVDNTPFKQSLIDPLLYDMHVLLSQNNWVEYAKFSLKYKGKDLNELSFGQRATAVVIMLLLFDKIIDFFV